MRKKQLIIVTVTALATSVMLSSCLGSFAMFNKVKAWNEQVGDKFINEVIFVAMWILPVYQLSFAADLLVLNSIEFWSGSNPLIAQQVQYIDGKAARYRVERDATGYAITNLKDNTVTRFNFNAGDNSWSLQNGNEAPIKFMSWQDDTHVNMLTRDGSFATVELSQAGVMAYRQLVVSDELFALH